MNNYDRQTYIVEIPQSGGKNATFVIRFSEPSDPVYQEGALVYVLCRNNNHLRPPRYVPVPIERLDSSINGHPFIGIEFGALNDMISGGGETFFSPQKIERLPEGIKWIDNSTFCENSSLRRLPESVEHLGDRCFEYSYIESIVLPSNIKHLGESCFYGSKIKEIVIPGSIKDIPERCFCNSSLKKIFVNEGVRSIGENGLASKEHDDRGSLVEKVIVLPRSISMLHEMALGRYFKGIIYAVPGSYAFFWAKEHNYIVESM